MSGAASTPFRSPVPTVLLRLLIPRGYVFRGSERAKECGSHLTLTPSQLGKFWREASPLGELNPCKSSVDSLPTLISTVLPRRQTPVSPWESQEKRVHRILSFLNRVINKNSTEVQRRLPYPPQPPPSYHGRKYGGAEGTSSVAVRKRKSTGPTDTSLHRASPHTYASYEQHDRTLGTKTGTSKR
ncbi:hypothetical protein BHE74_00049312 [Ensete ventricosum]|nr:hypothetical protein BHE74_00049312 [Ensete ventricosum]